MKKFHSFLFFWVLFFIPSMYFFPKALLMDRGLYLGLYDLTPQQKFMFSHMAETMPPIVDISTLEIIVINSFVALCLWFSVLLIYYFFHKRQEGKYQYKFILYLAIFCNAFFYIKEGLRMGYTVYSFSESMGIPYASSFLTLIFPHLIPEFTAFIITSILSMQWISEKMKYGKTNVSLKLFLIPFVILIFAGIVETTLTPFVFRSYLFYYL